MSLNRMSSCSWVEPIYTSCIGQRVGRENCGWGRVGDVATCWPGSGKSSDTVERVQERISLMISKVGNGGDEVFSRAELSSLGDSSKWMSRGSSVALDSSLVLLVGNRSRAF